MAIQETSAPRTSTEGSRPSDIQADVQAGVRRRREARQEIERLNEGTDAAVRAVLSGDSLAFLEGTPQAIGE